MRFSLFSILLLFAVGAALVSCSDGDAPGGQTPPPTDAPPTSIPAEVPPAFQSLYDELEARLETAHAGFSALPDAGGPPSLVLELLPANGNRGEDLLRPDTMETTRVFLDRFQELGADGVGVQIVYPLLDGAYPRSSEYLDFYRAVAAEVRQRDLTLIVETGAPFSGTEFSTLHVDYGGMTPESYLEARLATAATIARELRPDYLSLSDEQSTERMLTGLDLTTDDYLEFLRSAPEAIDPPDGVKLGAGSGSWENAELVNRLLDDSALDFIDVHVYPLSNGFTDYLNVAAEWARTAGAKGKEAVIGEAWLYKASVGELQSGVGFQELFGRDLYSFWQPLDALFMQTLYELGRATGVDYVSFFWSRYLFGYADYDEVPPETTGQALQRAANLAAWSALSRGELSATGEQFRRLAQTGEDDSPTAP